MTSELLQEVAYFGLAEIADPADTANQQQPQPPEAEPDKDEVIAAFVAQVIEGRSLTADFTAAAAWNNGMGWFATWADKVAALSTAYLAYLHARNDENAALEEAVKHPPFDAYKRRPKQGNPALIATMLVAKPHTLAERQACSEYATTLIWAAANEVRPERFTERVLEAGLKNCINFARNLRAKGKQSSPSDTSIGADDMPVSDADQEYADKTLADATKEPRNPSVAQVASPSTGDPKQSDEHEDRPAPTQTHRQTVEDTTSPPPVGKKPMPMQAAVPGDSRVQSAAAAIITITIQEENGASNSIRYPLNPTEAQIVLAINKKQYGTLLQYSRALVIDLNPPTRAGRNRVLQYRTGGRIRTTKYRVKGGRSTPVN